MRVREAPAAPTTASPAPAKGGEAGGGGETRGHHHNCVLCLYRRDTRRPAWHIRRLWAACVSGRSRRRRGVRSCDGGRPQRSEAGRLSTRGICCRSAAGGDRGLHPERAASCRRGGFRLSVGWLPFAFPFSVRWFPFARWLASVRVSLLRSPVSHRPSVGFPLSVVGFPFTVGLYAGLYDGLYDGFSHRPFQLHFICLSSAYHLHINRRNTLLCPLNYIAMQLVSVVSLSCVFILWVVVYGVSK